MPRRRASSQPDDLYAVLGVSPDASAAEIKRAYRRLAVKHHPDKRGGASNSDRISAINAAYDTLGTDDKRRAYDLQRPDVRASPSPLCRVQRFFVGRCGFPAFGLHRRVGSLHLHGAAEILHRAPITLLFLHLLRSEKTARASRVVLAVQRALHFTIPCYGVDVEAEAQLASMLGLPLEELPSIMLLAGGAGRQLAAPYTIETVLADVAAALPELKTACSADELHRFVRAGRQGRPAVLALAPGDARTSLRALCAGEQLACAVVPHARCSLLGELPCRGVALLGGGGALRRCVKADNYTGTQLARWLRGHAARERVGPLLAPPARAAAALGASPPLLFARHLLADVGAAPLGAAIGQAKAPLLATTVWGVILAFWQRGRRRSRPRVWRSRGLRGRPRRV